MYLLRINFCLLKIEKLIKINHNSSNKRHNNIVYYNNYNKIANLC